MMQGGVAVQGTPQDVANLAPAPAFADVTAKPTTLSGYGITDGLNNPMTTLGDLLIAGVGGAPMRLAADTDGFVLTLVSGVPAWQPGLTNPMSTVGDLIIGGASGAPMRLPIGAAGYVLKSDGTTISWQAETGGAPAWGTITGTLSAQTDLQGALDAKADGASLAPVAFSGAYADLTGAPTIPQIGVDNGINDQTGTSYTVAASDAGKEIRCTNAAAIALNIDTEANSGIADVTFWALLSQGGAGTVTVTALAGVTLRTPNGAATSAQYDARGISYLGTDEWRVW